MKKAISLLLVFMMTATLLFGCAKSDANKKEENGKKEEETQQASMEKVDGGTFVMPVTNDVSHLNAYLYQGDDMNETILKPLYDCLYYVTAEGVNYYLADSCTVSEDGLTYTLKLHEGAKWHDGEPITIDDFLFTMQSSCDPGTSSSGTSALMNIMSNETPVKLERVDDYTANIILPQPYSPYFTILGRTYIMPKHIYGNGTVTAWKGCDENMIGVGSGPYKLAQWNKGESIVYERNEDYYRGKPNLEKIVMKVIPDSSAQEVALQNNEVSMMRITNSTQLEKYKSNKDYTVYSFPEARLNYWMFRVNSDNGLMADPKARQAVAMALDIDQVIDGAYGSAELAVKANSIFPSTAMYYDKEIKNYDQNLEEAKKLAKESGLAGKTLRYIYNNQRPNMEDTAVMVQEQLKAIDVKVELIGVDSSSFFSNFFKRQSEIEWDMGSNGGDQMNADPGTKRTLFSGGWTTTVGGTSEANEAAWQKAISSLNEADRTAAYQECQKLAHEECSILPYNYTNFLFVVKNDFQGIDAKKTVHLFQDYLDLYQVAAKK